MANRLGRRPSMHARIAARQADNLRLSWTINLMRESAEYIGCICLADIHRRILASSHMQLRIAYPMYSWPRPMHAYLKGASQQINVEVVV